MRKALFAAFALFAATGLLVTGYLAWRSLEEEELRREGTYGLADLGSVGDFSFAERSGRQLGKRDLEGLVWIANFIFTSCPSVCPRLSTEMARLQRELAGVGVRLVSFTVDPERDTLEKLARYADSYGADPERWLFLRGEKETVHRFIQESFRLAVGEAKDEGSVLAMEITHSGKFVLVDRDGRIAGYFDGADPVALERLRGKAEALFRRGP